MSMVIVNTPEIEISIPRTPDAPISIQSPVRYRINVRAGEMIRLAQGAYEIRALAGTGSVLSEDYEMLLLAGETVLVTGEDNGVTISAQGEVTLVALVTVDAASEAHQQLKKEFYERMAMRQKVMQAEGRNAPE